MMTILKRKLALIITALITVSAAFTGCSKEEAAPFSADAVSTSETTSQNAELKPFSIGYLPSTGHLLYFVAQEEGFFKEEGLDVTLQLFDSNDTMLSSMLSGKLSAGALGSNEIITYIEQGYDVSIIGGIMKEGSALVVKPEVVEGVDPQDYSLELLRGKRIAARAKDATYVIFTKAFENAGLEIGKDVEFVTINGGNYQALQSPDVDASLLYTPFRAQAVKDGYVILTQAAQVEGFADYPCCRNTAPNAGLESDPDAYKSYLKALIRAYKFYQENEEKTVEDILVYLDEDNYTISI